MRINHHQSESINQLLSPSTNNNQHQSAIIINHHQYEFHSQNKKKCIQTGINAQNVKTAGCHIMEHYSLKLEPTKIIQKKANKLSQKKIYPRPRPRPRTRVDL